jgi:hypothetical protein
MKFTLGQNILFTNLLDPSHISQSLKPQVSTFSKKGLDGLNPNVLWMCKESVCNCGDHF